MTLRVLAFLTAAAAAVPLGAQPLPLTCGIPVEAFVNIGTTVNFSFSAEAGEAVALRVVSLVDDSKFRVSATLAVGGLTKVSPRTNKVVLPNALEYDLIAAGSYTFSVTGTAEIPGRVRVTLVRLNRPCGSNALACGIPASVPIATAGQVQTVQFTGETGDIFSLRLIGGSLPDSTIERGTTFYGLIYNPSGKLQLKEGGTSYLFSAWGVSGPQPLDFKLPAAGTYTMVMLEGTSLSRTGALSVVAVKLNGGCGVKTAKCGATADSTLPGPAAIETYRLQAEAGDVYTLKLARTDTAGGFQPTAEVYDPSGTLVSRLVLQSNSSRWLSTATVSATTAGTYNIVVRDGGYANAGTYSLAAARVNKPCGGRALGCASVVDARIDGVLRFSTYSISVSAGDAYLARVLRTGTGGNFKPRVEIYDPQGNTTQVLAAADYARAVFTAPTEGLYTVLVWDGYDGGQDGAFSLSSTRLNGPCNATAVTCGAAVTGSIDGALRTGTYTWTAAAGESFTARLLDTSGTLRPAVEVYDAAGRQVGAAVANGYGVDVSRPDGGEYTVLASAASTATGAFTFEILRTRNACGVAPAQGQTVTGAISGTTPFVSYALNASAGDNLLVRSASVTSTFSASMDLYDPDGNRLDSGAYSLTRRAPATGTYVVVMSASDPRTGGGYAFSWQRLNAPANATLVGCGGATAGLLSASNQFRYYAVQAEAGDVLRLVLTRITSNFSPRLEIFDPSGSRLAFSASDLTQKAAAAGYYLLLVSPSTAAADAGDFVLAFQRPNNPCSPVKLGCGQSVLRPIRVPGQMDAITFSGNPGDRMTLKFLVRSGDLASYTELYDPAGGLLQSGSGGQITTTLASEGSYVVLVRDLAGTGVGSYRASLQRPLDACPVDDTEAPVISLIRPTGGEVVTGASSFRIAWQSDDNVDIAAHEIRYSTDGGRTFPTVIATLGGATQVYDWLPPEGLTPTRNAQIRVTATDSAGNSRSVTSDALTAIGSGFEENFSVSYSYDSLDRLTTAIYGTGRTIWYTYDAAGNLVQITVGQ